MTLWRRLYNITRSNLRRDVRSAGSVSAEVDGFQPEYSSRPAAPPQDPLEARYYANLELAPGASYAEIKAAYRGLLSKYHPDKHHGDPDRSETAGEISRGLNEAMEYFERAHKGGR
jgi:DnaJ-domain-containing protein 1